MTDIIAMNALPESIREAIHIGTTRIRCPACQGGTTGEFSLSIRRAENIKTLPAVSLICFRASCGWRAVVVTDTQIKYTTKVPEANVFREPVNSFDIRRHIFGALCQRFPWLAEAETKNSLSNRGWGFVGDIHPAKLAQPILGPHGERRGVQTRTYLPDGQKRVMTYKETAKPLMDFWRGATPRYSLVVVEDQLSAARVALDLRLPAIALLGTHIGWPEIREIKEFAHELGVKHTILALDRDAFKKAVSHARRFQGFHPMHVACLTDDLKDCETADDARRPLVACLPGEKDGG